MQTGSRMSCGGGNTSGAAQAARSVWRWALLPKGGRPSAVISGRVREIRRRLPAILHTHTIARWRDGLRPVQYPFYDTGSPGGNHSAFPGLHRKAGQGSGLPPGGQSFRNRVDRLQAPHFQHPGSPQAGPRSVATPIRQQRMHTAVDCRFLFPFRSRGGGRLRRATKEACPMKRFLTEPRRSSMHGTLENGLRVFAAL